ncbi:MAG: hypothetical protein ACRYGR_05620 [Janthinobacterium lividum]
MLKKTIGVYANYQKAVQLKNAHNRNNDIRTKERFDMEKIRQLDDKILQLKQRKDEAEIKLARALLKKVQGILGKDTDVNLATLILQETWESAREENKEVWRHKAGSFRRSRVTEQTESNKIGESKSAEVGNTKLTEATKSI